MKIDKYFHLYGRKDDVVFEEIEKPELKKKGKWLPWDGSYYMCSECRAVRELTKFMENYCPNCGAEMEVDE